MNKRSDRFIPLAKVKRGVTLSSSSAGDQYFLVKTNGSSDKIPLEKACKLYIAAKEKGDLLWGRSSTKKGSKKKATTTKSHTSSQAWRDELREKLGYEPNPE